MSRTQLEAVRKMLRELSDMSEHASLTGALSGGAAHATARYNRMLELLEEEQVVPPGMFGRLDEQNTGFGQLAVESRLLLASLQEEEDEPRGRHGQRGGHGLGALLGLAPFLDKEDLEKLVRQRLEEAGPIGDQVLVGLAPFLNKDLLGEIISRRMTVSEPPSPPEPPAAPPSPPEPPTPPREAEPFAAWPGEKQNEELSRLAARLAEPGLPPEERSRIAARLAELARQPQV